MQINKRDLETEHRLVSIFDEEDKLQVSFKSGAFKGTAFCEQEDGSV